MSQFKVDIYTHPHKGYRKSMFELSMLAARTDAASKAERRELMEKSLALFNDLAEHARHENTYAHPIICYKLPHQKELLQKEHEEQEQNLAHLSAAVQLLAEEQPENDQINNLLLEYYRSLNRFIADYLLHLDQEEYSMQNLW